MGQKPRIPVHPLTAKAADLYLAPFPIAQPGTPPYEASELHRHDFYYCVLLDQGQLELEVDFQRVRLTGQSLFLSYPGQLHRVVSARLERGWFVAFAPTWLDEPLRAVLDQLLAEVLHLSVAPALAAQLGGLLQQAHAVVEEPTQLFRHPILRALVQALVYQVAGTYLAQEQLARPPQSARRLELTKAFRQLLRQQYATLKMPADFARQLHVSVRHLNDTVRAITGFSLTYCVQQQVMREAQRLLAHSALSVSEIAYQVGYDDPKYFTLLFRQVVGVPPTTFRQQQAGGS